MIYTAFVDVSGGHDGSPVMTMAGYVARAGQWANLDHQFARLLKKNKLTYHHTKKMFHNEGEYSGWKWTQKNRYLTNVQKIIAGNTLCGFVISMKQSDFEKHYANGDRPQGVSLDGKYGICFRLFLTQMPQMLHKSLTDVELHIVLEDGDRGIDDSERIFQSFKAEAAAELSNMVKSRIKADKKDFYGLQIADWVAFASFRAEQGTPNLTGYPKDASLQQAGSLVRYKSPVFRWEITPTVLMTFKQRLSDHRDLKKKLWQERKKSIEASSVHLAD